MKCSARPGKDVLSLKAPGTRDSAVIATRLVQADNRATGESKTRPATQRFVSSSFSTTGRSFAVEQRSAPIRTAPFEGCAPCFAFSDIGDGEPNAKRPVVLHPLSRPRPLEERFFRSRSSKAAATPRRVVVFRGAFARSRVRFLTFQRRRIRWPIRAVKNCSRIVWAGTIYRRER